LYKQTMASNLSETLERQLMFPLPRSDDIRTNEDPIIPRNHPIHDYFASDNWQGSIGPNSRVNRVIIAPATLTVPFAGLFTPFNHQSRTKLQSAVQTNLSGDKLTWQNLVTSDDMDDVLKKLERFVKGVAVEYTRDVTGEAEFDLNADMEPTGYDVFPVPVVNGTAITSDEAKVFQRSTSAYTKLKVAHGNTKADRMFDCLRIFYAYKFLDHIFVTPDEYFFIQRLVGAAKLLYVAQLFRMVGESEKFDQVLGWMHSSNVQYASVDPNTNALEQKYDADGKPLPRKRGEKWALDDMFRRNVELSHDVKAASAELLETKTLVADARDNLQSLANSDDLVQKQQFNSKIIYFVAITLLVLQVAGLVAAEYLQSPLVGYVIIVLFAAVVLVIEATKGLTSLINI
jgi:hypothetical protein